jgi:hypothetical protein
MFGKNVIIDNDNYNNNNNNSNNQNIKTNKKLIFGSSIIIDNEDEFKDESKKDEKQNIYTKNYTKMTYNSSPYTSSPYTNSYNDKPKIKNNNYSKPSNLAYNNGKEMSCQSKAIILSEIS